MRLERTAQRAARAVYGSIIALAVIVLLDQAGAPAREVIAATIGSVAAASLAELYAEYIGFTIRDRRHPGRGRLSEEIGDVVAGSLAALAPLIPFLGCAAGLIELDTAYEIARWLGVGVIGTYTILANRLAGLSTGRNAVVTAVALAVGFALIAIKTLTH